MPSIGQIADATVPFDCSTDLYLSALFSYGSPPCCSSVLSLPRPLRPRHLEEASHMLLDCQIKSSALVTVKLQRALGNLGGRVDPPLPARQKAGRIPLDPRKGPSAETFFAVRAGPNGCDLCFRRMPRPLRLLNCWYLPAQESSPKTNRRLSSPKARDSGPDLS